MRSGLSLAEVSPGVRRCGRASGRQAASECRSRQILGHHDLACEEIRKLAETRTAQPSGGVQLSVDLDESLDEQLGSQSAPGLFLFQGMGVCRGVAEVRRAAGERRWGPPADWVVRTNSRWG